MHRKDQIFRGRLQLRRCLTIRLRLSSGYSADLSRRLGLSRRNSRATDESRLFATREKKKNEGEKTREREGNDWIAIVRGFHRDTAVKVAFSGPPLTCPDRTSPAAITVVPPKVSVIARNGPRDRTALTSIFPHRDGLITTLFNVNFNREYSLGNSRRVYRRRNRSAIPGFEKFPDFSETRDLWIK